MPRTSTSPNQNTGALRAKADRLKRQSARNVPRGGGRYAPAERSGWERFKARLGPRVVIDSELVWFAVWCLRSPRKLEQRLSDAGHSVWRPSQSVVVIRRGRAVDDETPLGSYIFVGVNASVEAARVALCAFRRAEIGEAVRQPVPYRDRRGRERVFFDRVQLAPAPFEEILGPFRVADLQLFADALAGRNASGDPEMAAVASIFEEGEEVRISAGPFAAFNGAIEQVDVGRKRVKVALSIFGRATPVELEFGDVEKT